MKTYLLFFISTTLLILSMDIELFGMQNEKSRARISMNYFKNSENKSYLAIRVLTRKERWVGVENVKIAFFLNETSLGDQLTDKNGEIIFYLPEKFYQKIDTLSEFIFFAVLKDDPNYQDTENELTIRKAFLDIGLIDHDSIKIVEAKVLEKDSVSNDVPQEEIQIKLLVVRPFSLLPLNEGTTDEDGKVLLEFPRDLPGDQEGVITIVVKIEDHEYYGNIEKRQSINWGIPTHVDDLTLKRSLWAAGANAPLPLILLTNLLILVVWGFIAYMVYKIYQISKI